MSEYINLQTHLVWKIAIVMVIVAIGIPLCGWIIDKVKDFIKRSEIT